MVIYASCRGEELSVSSTVCKCVAHRFLTVFGHVGVMEWGANHPQRVIRAACHHDLRHVGSRGAGYAWQAVGSRKAGFFSLLCVSPFDLGRLVTLWVHRSTESWPLVL